MLSYYILNGKEVVPVSIDVWSAWFVTADRKVALTVINPEEEVSTVFWGMDHNCSGGSPILFETMVVGGPEDANCIRYHTWDEAFEGHWKTVNRLTGGNLVHLSIKKAEGG